MIIQEGTELGNNTIVKNPVTGEIVNKISWFCTKTKLAKMYAQIVTKNDKGKIFSAVATIGSGHILPKDENDSIHNEVVTFICKLQYCKAYNKETGEEIL